METVSEAMELIIKLKKLVANVDAQFVEIGKLLLELRDRGWSTRTISDQVGWPYRKMAYLVQVAAFIADHELDADRVVSVGWTKVSIIATAKPDDPEYWLDRAKEVTAEVLKSELRGGSGVRTVVFNLTPEQYDLLNNRLAKFGALTHGRGQRNKEQALMALLVKGGEGDMPYRQSAA